MENAERNKKFTALLIMVLIAVECLALPLLFSGCTKVDNQQDSNQIGDIQKEEQPVELNIFCVGDVMVHKSQIACQYDKNTGKYDYTNNYKYVKDYISSADLALCNIETTFAGAPYSGYPDFSAPDELADALKDTGFDVAITSNNHMMDKGGNGLKRTLDVLRQRGFLTAGSRLNQEEDRFTIADVKGVKVGVVPYTYETPSSEGTAINGRLISEENANLINSFSYQTLEKDLLEIKNTCESAEKAGAEILVLYFHWGEEYSTSANQWQRQIADYFVNNTNVDVIFGSHPHVLQEMEYIKNETTGKTVPVFYSMGNFISNQRKETLDNRYTEQGVIAKVNLKYQKSTKSIVDINMSAVPTWVEKYSFGGSPVYEIIPLDDKLRENETLKASGHLSRAERALEDANGILKTN
ncbi:MAG: CapA family protein [Aminipila sp.]